MSIKGIGRMVHQEGEEREASVIREMIVKAGLPPGGIFRVMCKGYEEKIILTSWVGNIILLN